jgi:hypothetical protein
LNREGHPSSSHQSTLWVLFDPEGGGSRDSCLGGGEFELLVEIVNPIPAESLEFGNYEERMTEEEVSQRAGQRPGKLALYGQARYGLNDNFCHWTGDQERKVRQRNKLHCLAGK